MIALLAVFVDAIGYIMLAIFCIILLSISSHRNRKAAAGRPRTPAPVPRPLREFYVEPPPPAPKPRPVPAEPVYLRRWGFHRQKWAAEEREQWDAEFDRLNRLATARARWDAAPKEAPPPGRSPGADLYEKLRRNLQDLG